MKPFDRKELLELKRRCLEVIHDGYDYGKWKYRHAAYIELHEVLDRLEGVECQAMCRVLDMAEADLRAKREEARGGGTVMIKPGDDKQPQT